MRISVSVGEYAKTPYYVPRIERSVYCMEELCYCIREDAFLLDLTFLNDGLLDWIERECGLRDLARALYPLVHKQGSLSSFAVMILQYVGLYDNEVIREVEQVLKQAAGLSAIERRKSQIDHLVRKKMYPLALKNYDALLQKWQEQDAEGKPLPAVSCLAAIWHNKGVAFAGLMRYDNAAECFLKACELEAGNGSYVDYLAAMRMQLKEKEYIDLVAEHGVLHTDSMELENRFEQAVTEWKQQPDYLRLNSRQELRVRDRQKYLEESERLIQALKDSYRSTVGV